MAGFRQHTSRAGDPHVHTHAVVVAKVRDERGGWYALDARMIKHDQRTLSALYHSCLRTELTRRVGVHWRVPDNGIAELAGVSDDVLARFSTRTDHLERRLQDKLDRFRTTVGREPTDKERWRLEREAAVDSRPSKHRVPGDRQSGRWRRQLGELGLTPEQFTADVIGRHLTPTGITAQQATRIVTDAQVELFETGSTWRRNDVIREIARRIPTDVTSPSDELVGWIERTVDTVLERHVELAPRIGPNTPLRRDGRPVTESTMDRRFTTTTILCEEEYLGELGDGTVRGPRSTSTVDRRRVGPGPAARRPSRGGHRRVGGDRRARRCGEDHRAARRRERLDQRRATRVRRRAVRDRGGGVGATHRRTG